MVFAQIGGAVPNAGVFSFIFRQKSRSHKIYNTWGYKHYNTTHVIFKQIIGSHFLLKKKPPKHDFTVK